MNKIKIDYSFIIIWSIFYFFDENGLLPIFFFAAVIHEMGHYIVLKILGGHLVYLRLSAFGAEMRVSMPESYFSELFIAFAGPAFNFLVAYILSCLGFNVAAGASVILGIFNLLPTQPLDGGKILEICLCLSPLEHYASSISNILSGFTSVGVLIIGIAVFFYTMCNISIFLIGAFLTVGQLKNQQVHFRYKNP